MLRDHYLFLIILGVFFTLILGATFAGIKEFKTTAYAVSKVMYCEPMSCSDRGLMPTGKFYCDKDKCYRDCYQGDVVIKMATFCSKSVE